MDLRGHGPFRIGASGAIAHDGNHAAGGALSAAVHATVPEAEGRVEVLRRGERESTGTTRWPGLRNAGQGLTDCSRLATFRA